LTLFAGKAVGAVAATLAVTELLRLLHGGPIHELIDLDLKSPDYRSAVKTQHDFSTLNPGCFLPGRDRSRWPRRRMADRTEHRIHSEECNRVSWRCTPRYTATAKRRWDRDIVRLLMLRK
jgi:hypothetical protein